MREAYGMKRSAWFVVVSSPYGRTRHIAQQAAALNDKQLLGMQLFNQSCRVVTPSLS
jgi:hypothetical protein